MATVWREEAWSRGILLGLRPDPNSGYRATVWFEYTRNLFNEIREGSLIAVRNFSDRVRKQDGSPASERNASYEEYSILQIDQMHPWHYAIQGGGEQGYPAFTVAAAESARADWTSMDTDNRDDVSRIRCEAIPLRLAFRVEQSSGELPKAFFDRSMPMPGFEVRLLSAEMTETVINRDVEDERAFVIGSHVVQYNVKIKVQREELARLHFGIFGYTGAGKSNLVSSLVHNLLRTGKQPLEGGNRAFKVVLVDLMDEYTGLLIDHLVTHEYSQLVVCGRLALSNEVFQACLAVANNMPDAAQQARKAATDWSRRLILPSELKPYSNKYVEPLARMIMDGKVVFYEPQEQQWSEDSLDIQKLDDDSGPKPYTDNTNRDQRVANLCNELTELLQSAEEKEGSERQGFLDRIIQRLQIERDAVRTDKAKKAIDNFIERVENLKQARDVLPYKISIDPRQITRRLNFQPSRSGHFYYPSIAVVIGENEKAVAEFMRRLIVDNFNHRRTESILYPTISFIFDEADVFIGQRSKDSEATLIEQATMLARRGRKFGLGIGIATQRVRFLDTSIMAQPHTYFISKLPRRSDREAIAEAFAISDETFEQTFGFTVGKWLITSQDATGLKGVPFPVQLPNANARVAKWLDAWKNSGSPTQLSLLERR